MREQPYRLPEPKEMVGQYRVVGELGQGGQGHVYKAECAGRCYVLKFFRSRPVCPSGELELDILRHLEHTNVVRVLGHGRWPDPERGYFYIVMEWVEGQTLLAHALEHNPSARQGATLLLKAARALGAVHRLRVLHQDVKPDNLLVRAADGEPVWVDFGVGHLEGRATLPRMRRLPAGTPEYTSPEAYRFLQEHLEEEARYQPGVADEVWALGVTAYELLTDELPFGSRMSNPQLVKDIRTRTPVAPHEDNPRVPVALSQVCMRMLEKEPGARLADMEAVAAALEEALAGAGEDWDVPLMDPDAPRVRTTEEIPGKVVDRDSWERVQQQLKAARPRRGRVRKARHQPPPPPEAPVAPPSSKAPVPAHRARSGPRVRALAVTLLVGALLVAGTWSLWFRMDSRGVPLPAAHPWLVRELAVSGEPSEAGGGAAATLDPPPASIFATMPRKNDARLKPPEKPAPRPQRRAPVCMPTRQEMCVVGLCTVLLTGCTSTPQVVRPPPRPADCPPEALKAMKELGIQIGDTAYATFPVVGGAKPVKVRESSPLETFEALGQLGRVELTGRLYLGPEHVHGRFTQVRTHTGKTYPVCLELVHDEGFDWKPGVERRDVGGPSDSAVVVSSQRVRAVDRFE